VYYKKKEDTTIDTNSKKNNLLNRGIEDKGDVSQGMCADVERRMG
jgi:hypothetical protein